MKTVRHPRNARDPLLHIEADGCLVNIEVGLTDADGHHVTRVDISPDDESRGGDRTGHIWYQDGARIVRLEPGESRPMRINFTITGSGQSLADVENAVLEALEGIKGGNLLGFDRNETGSFHFEVDGREEENHRRPVMRHLQLEVRAQEDTTQLFARQDGIVLAMGTPNIDEDYWLFRVRLTDDQAIVGFPKFGTIGIGFARETDWNTNLPYDEPTERLFEHIERNKGDDAIPSVDVLAAIKLVQDAARLYKEGPAVT